MIIRQAHTKDAAVIVALIHELAETIGESSPLTPEFVHTYLAHSGSAILLAEEDDVISGLLSYTVKPDLYHTGYCAEVEALVVTRQARGKGVGGLLMEHILEIGQREGWAEISVSTAFENQAAQDFYRRHGMTDESILLERHLTE
jgi:ribosomal protein S18 acetylase RimI-like enzyme